MTKEEYLQESIRNLSGFSFADMINLSKEEFYKALESRKGPKRVVSASTTPLDSDSSDDESPKPSSSSGKRSYSYDHLFSRHDLSSKLDIRPKCKYGNTCNQLYDEKHMKEFSHPFLPPCCFKNSCSEYGDEAHKFSHPCRYGSQCRELKDPHHTQYYSHAERKVCEHDKECLCIHDRDHMLRVKHTGALDFRHEYINQDIDFDANVVALSSSISNYSINTGDLALINMLSKIDSGDRSVDFIYEYVNRISPQHRCKEPILKLILSHGTLLSRVFQKKMTSSPKEACMELVFTSPLITQSIMHERLTLSNDVKKWIVELLNFQIDQRDNKNPKSVTCKLKLSKKCQQEVEGVIKDIVRAVFSHTVTGIGCPLDLAVKTDQQVFSIVGINKADYYGDILFILNRKIMFHPDFNMSLEAATHYVDRPGEASKTNKWRIPPGNNSNSNYENAKLHPAAKNFHKLLAKDMAVYHFKLFGSLPKSVDDLVNTSLHEDPHNVYEGHLPPIVPVSYISHVIMPKKVFDNLSDAEKKVLKVVILKNKADRLIFKDSGHHHLIKSQQLWDCKKHKLTEMYLGRLLSFSIMYQYGKFSMLPQLALHSSTKTVIELCIRGKDIGICLSPTKKADRSNSLFIIINKVFFWKSNKTPSTIITDGKKELKKVKEFILGDIFMERYIYYTITYKPGKKLRVERKNMNIISSKKASQSKTTNSTPNKNAQNSSLQSTPNKSSSLIKSNSNQQCSFQTPTKSSTTLRTPSSIASSSSLKSSIVSSSSSSTDVYQVAKNAALSSNERNTEQCLRAIKYFAEGKFELALGQISLQTTKSFLSKLVSYKCFYHMSEIEKALLVLKNLYNDTTTLTERGEEDVIGSVQISIMFAQIVLFKLIPKRLTFKCLLAEESEILESGESISSDLDIIKEYLRKIVNMLDKAREDLKKLENEWINFDREEAPFDLTSIINQLKWFIMFYKGVAHFRTYEYVYTKNDYEEWKKILETLSKKGQFLHVDFFYMRSHLSFMEGELEKALFYLNKAERSEEHCKKTIKEHVGGVNATDAMWILDDSALSFDVFDMIQDLKSKITFSQYLEKRMVLREVSEKKELERLIREIRSVSIKRRQHNASLAERTKQFDGFLGTLAQTMFKNFDCSIIEKFRIYGQYRYVVHLAKSLLNSDKPLSHSMKIACVHYLVEALYYLKRFSECVSTYSIHSDLFKNIDSSQEHRLLKVNYFVVDSTITINLEGGSLTWTIQESEALIKQNLKITKEVRQLYLALRFYKFLGRESAATLLKHLFTSIQKDSSITYSEFFTVVEQYSSRNFTIKIGTSKSLIATPNKTNEATPQKSATPSAVDDLVTYSNFEDFSPLRLQSKMKKQNQALEELKRKREAQQSSSTKKTKTE
ncbi:predicted protein [Naegleria gruberi]|uniref:Predicted protein n=1 Tax=Naegleria gruberi TaxID=5762 RepID=D2VNE5_NAEGR|nr:uncharacterized protein NAEGRDRAFT_50979 [Naegleria gruberi]EFC41644.1 predicted protein [Naegleria gruberi]|eukprot:XP_002674388.1 predicted protein [Naegleria gruberi strain NEG-M]